MQNKCSNTVGDSIENKIYKLKMLGILKNVWCKRFASIISKDGLKFMDLVTNTTYPGILVDIDYNDGGILLAKISKDGLDDVKYMRTIVFISKEASWMENDKFMGRAFDTVGKPINLEGTANVYNYYKDEWVNEHSVLTDSDIIVIRNKIEGLAFQHNVFHLVNIRESKIIASIHSSAIDSIKSIDRKTLHIQFFNLVDPTDGVGYVSDEIAYEVTPNGIEQINTFS